ncbi:MAG: threonine synthase [Polyangia bacterium]
MVRFVSTRGSAPARSLTDAIAKGLAPDGGLYVPEAMPRADLVSLRSAKTLAERATALLTPWFEGDTLAPSLSSICEAAFTFDAPLVSLGDDSVLELFHGPTAAFKDFGARFLAETLSRAGADGTVLVATSGDTGAAVAAAFAGRPGFKVVVLYPDGRVSPRQAHQLGAFGDNVRALRVAGSFDDCQALVKRAFADEALTKQHRLRSANSISLGRLLPQMAYHAHAAMQLPGASFVVPTGNLGNAQACLWARAMGLPIDRVVLATNANRVIVDLVNEGLWSPGPSRSTLANAMDVGAPSNVERLRVMYTDAQLSGAVSAESVDDDAIRKTIVETWRDHHYALCPHTACAVAVRRHQSGGPWVIVATAHPAKFESIVEPLVGAEIAAPAALAELLARPSHADPLPADYDAFVSALQ